MDKLDKYKKIIEKQPDTIESALDILKAYHKIDSIGGNDLDLLCFEYATELIVNPHLKKAFESHLIRCQSCMRMTATFRRFVEIHHQVGDKIMAKIDAKEVIDKLKGARALIERAKSMPGQDDKEMKKVLDDLIKSMEEDKKKKKS